MSFERTGTETSSGKSALTGALRRSHVLAVETVPCSGPRSTAEVRAYYESCEGDYYNFDLMLRAVLRAAGEALHPTRWRDIRGTFAATAVILAHLPALAMISPRARQHANVPAALDPIINTLFRVTRPTYALLGIPAIGDRLTAWTVGPEGAPT